MSDAPPQLHDPRSWAVWCSIPGIIVGMVLASGMSQHVLFSWDWGTVMTGIAGGIVGASLGAKRANRLNERQGK
jgi:uncharacterized membrane protein YfcA